MLTFALLPLSLSMAAAQAEPAALPPPLPCADKGGLLPGTGLCRADALARLPLTTWTPPQGCDRTAQEVRLTHGRWLLYAAQRCGETVARLAVTPQQGGALVLRYAEVTRNTELLGRRTLTLVEGRAGEEHLAIYTLVTGGLPPAQAQRCALRTPPSAGYPYDAFLYDLAPAEARQTAALDQPCGSYGRSALKDSYWRVFDGIGVFTTFGYDQPEFDPASLAVYTP